MGNVVVASRQMPWGWRRLGPRWTLEDPEEGGRVTTRTNKEHTTIYPGSEPSLGGKTPTPACLLSIYVYNNESTTKLPELPGWRKKKALRALLPLLSLSLWFSLNLSKPFVPSLRMPWVALYTRRPGHIRVRVSSFSLVLPTWRMSTL